MCDACVYLSVTKEGELACTRGAAVVEGGCLCWKAHRRALIGISSRQEVVSSLFYINRTILSRRVVVVYLTLWRYA